MYHKYKVLEDFVFLNGRIEYHGDTLNFDEGAYNHDKIFIDSLVLHGFLEVIEEKPKTVWDLKEGDGYYHITSSGSVADSTWYDCDIARREAGDAFLTREEAEKELERRRAKQILLRDTKGYRPDWGGDNSNYEVYYGYESKKLLIDGYTFASSHKDLWFASKEDAEASINAHEKEWKIYLGVEDE